MVYCNENIGSITKCLPICIIYYYSSLNCHYKIVIFGYLIDISTTVLSKYNRKIILQYNRTLGHSYVLNKQIANTYTPIMTKSLTKTAPIINFR